MYLSLDQCHELLQPAASCSRLGTPATGQWDGADWDEFTPDWKSGVCVFLRYFKGQDYRRIFDRPFSVAEEGWKILGGEELQASVADTSRQQVGVSLFVLYSGGQDHAQNFDRSFSYSGEGSKTAQVVIPGSKKHNKTIKP